MTEYERNWLKVNPTEYIAHKIRTCQENYPHDKPRYAPYYDAMIEELRRVQSAGGVQ